MATVAGDEELRREVGRRSQHRAEELFEVSPAATTVAVDGRAARAGGSCAIKADELGEVLAVKSNGGAIFG
jgi:hypothetical protein